MNELEECFVRYKKLISLLEQDYEEIGLAIGGDVPEAYRKLLKKEISETRKMMQLLRQQL